MTFDDIALDPLTLRAAERLSEHLQILGDVAPKGREHWSACLRMFVRIHTAQTMVTTPLTVDDVIPASDREALATLQPELDRLLSTVWQHGQWKLGELNAWQRVWMYLRELHETLTREVGDGAG